MDQVTDNWLTSFDRASHIAIAALYFFALAVAVIRILGKRGAGQMTNFDWILTVAIGSLMSSGILLRNVAVLDATVAILVIAAAQFALTWAVDRWEPLEFLVRGRPRLLTHKGLWLDDDRRAERVTREEVRAALRRSGVARVEDANWVVLETDGSFSVVPRQSLDLDEADLLDGVHHAGEGASRDGG